MNADIAARVWKDAYVVDRGLLEFLDGRVRQATGEANWRISFYGGAAISRSDPIAKVLEEPIFDVHTIESVSVDGGSYLNPAGTRVSFRVRRGFSVGGLDVVGGREACEGIAKEVSDHMIARRPWYWWLYRAWTEFFVLASALPVAVWLPSTVLGATLLPVAVFAVFLFLRFLLFKRVEFAIGRSERGWAARRGMRRWLGGTLIVSTLVLGVISTLFASWVAQRLGWPP
ncbi:hypothetical protein GCM10007913_11920 [Devosia yakushimensis]|uniref:Uncharacterized protein n=1 Tax=Devosia yakushimensis TaxID=470028 RepID=A0ABQ5UBZ7_9HYPH|nr:hypothetical protein [Devosia yakushimensis]GLQ09260.1 hypothetical protein GCM10007913_11920 [Devosia yakushimensis]